LSLLLGTLATKFFKLPSWVIPAVAFNNTTSLPLLLVQSLEATGILNKLILSGDDTSSAISRAQSFFLVNAVVGNCLTFAIGPRLIDCEHSPDNDDDNGPDDSKDNSANQQNGHAHHDEPENPDEQTSLLPQPITTLTHHTTTSTTSTLHKYYTKLPHPVQSTLSILYDFLNTPLIGATIGTMIGLIPPLQRAFFSTSTSGGYLNAWLTQSLSNTGQLFVTLQVIVVGVSLSSSLRKTKRGDDDSASAGHIPRSATLFILFIRFILWPALSITIIYNLSTHTKLLNHDPILWFHGGCQWRS
jgi:auxin efflux carrier family protein